MEQMVIDDLLRKNVDVGDHCAGGLIVPALSSLLKSHAPASVALVQPSETGHGLQLSKSWNTGPFTTLALTASDVHISTPTTVRSCRRHDDRRHHAISYHIDQARDEPHGRCRHHTWDEIMILPGRRRQYYPAMLASLPPWHDNSAYMQVLEWHQSPSRYCLNLDNLVPTSDVKALTARFGAATSQRERLSIPIIQDCFTGAAISDTAAIVAHLDETAVGLVVPSWDLMPVPTSTPTWTMIPHLPFSDAVIDAFAFLPAIPPPVLNEKDEKYDGGVGGVPKMQVPEGEV
ncbi:uncharacterized protein EV420DRAFT_1487505 [Desarmillaria tabescens]|uniref:Uncharacterized protein n=1 Tax=Armillaria tabescens TaxID=1929756 RepID=A0AA39J5E8_ARMTA|nr:uncharacterized protein EV420DRAFT_1487505 [Desarmillaria tabescens]KAK0436477.1 hypothetical protein EV420DRAFT_1487505 [Desarmillaria tabescens]